MMLQAYLDGMTAMKDVPVMLALRMGLDQTILCDILGPSQTCLLPSLSSSQPPMKQGAVSARLFCFPLMDVEAVPLAKNELA